MFQQRLVDTRNALRDLGIMGDMDEINPRLSALFIDRVGEATYQVGADFTQVGPGANVVGIAWFIRYVRGYGDNAESGDLVTIQDDLARSPEEIADALRQRITQDVKEHFDGETLRIEASGKRGMDADVWSSDDEGRVLGATLALNGQTATLQARYSATGNHYAISMNEANPRTASSINPIGLLEWFEREAALPTFADIPDAQENQSAASEDAPLTPEQRIARVKAAYAFDAEDAVLTWFESSMDESSYSPFVTARAMCEGTGARKAIIRWTLGGSGALGEIIVGGRGGIPVGYIDLAGDGKTMVFLDEARTERVRFASGHRAMYSDDDAESMIEALFDADQRPVEGVGSVQDVEDAPATSSDRAETEASSAGDDAESLEQGSQPAAEPVPLILNARHYHLGNTLDREGGFAAKTRFKDNMTALRTLREIERSGRETTEEDRAVMARYVGWGGLHQALDTGYSPEWRNERQEIRDLITEGIITQDEFYDFQASTINAHYTSPEVVRGIWAAVQKMGYAPNENQRGRILEPSVGTGNFLGLAPDEIVDNSFFMAVEKEPVSGGIARQLYPDADIRISPFEKVKTGLKFDVVIGNVPFGNIQPYDPDYMKESLSIHNYFLARSLDMTKPGGINALITSSYTMDAKGNRSVRQMLAERGDLIGAIRLPTSAFEAQANTTVTTDILLFRRYAPGEEVNRNPAWLDSEPVKAVLENAHHSNGVTVDVMLNRYYIDHPEMIATGAPSTKARKHRYAGRDNYEIQVDMPENLESRIRDIVDRYIPTGVFTALSPASVDLHPVTHEERLNLAGVSRLRVGSFVVMEDDGLGVIDNIEGDTTALVVPYEAPNKRAEKRILDYIPVRDAMLDLLDQELRDDNDNSRLIVEFRVRLNAVYDAFVEMHGPVNLPVNERLFAPDPLSTFASGLENYDPESRTAQKANFFERRTVGAIKPIDKASSPMEALALCLAEYGQVFPHKIVEYLDAEWNEVFESIKDRIYLNPASGEWETADRYLSGRVRDKLKAAQDAAMQDLQFERNVKSLEATQPQWIVADDIVVQLGVPWIKQEVIQQFAEEIFNCSSNRIAVTYQHELGAWDVEAYSIRDSATSVVTWGTHRSPGHEILECLLNQKSVKVFDRDENDKRVLNIQETLAAQAKAAAMHQKFKTWLWDDEERAADLEREYNERYNSLRIAQYDGSHLTFPGMSSLINLRAHQKNAIWQYIQEGTLIAAHEVGLGKTFMMVAAGMECKRLGLARKPLIVVPNHMLQQFANEARQLYPTSNILVMDKENMSPKRRRSFLGKAVMQDWDLCIITQSQFSRISVSPEVERDEIEREVHHLRIALDAMEDRGGNTKSRRFKSVQKKIQGYESRLQALHNAKSKDDTIYFDQLGFDMLIVDEAHHYKNRETPTQIDDVAGLSTQGSQRTSDMIMKINDVYRKNGEERGLIFATGTPISNSLSEAFNLIRTTRPSILDMWNAPYFDAFAAMFMEKRSEVEVSADSVTHKMRTRLYPINVPEMMTALRTVMDVQRAENHPGIIKRPEAKTIQVVAERSFVQDIFSLELANRAQNCSEGDVRPEEDNILKIASDGRKASLDMRLVDARIPDHPESKVNKLVENVHAIWARNHDTKAAQIIFCDLGTPGERKPFTVYDDIKRKLVDKGLREDEVAFIHDAKNDDEKESLFERVRSGEVRVIIGSTEKMGTGTNIQRRLITIHHLDAPWRPSDIEQRDGRIIRQGNMFQHVERYIYSTKGSFDVFMWQLMKAKSEAINAIMRCDPGVRRFDENADLTYADVLSVTTGNSYIKEKVEVERKIAVLEAGERAAYMQARQLKTLISMNETKIAASRSKQEDIRGMLSIIDGFIEREGFKAQGASVDASDGLNALKASKEQRLLWCLEGVHEKPVTRKQFMSDLEKEIDQKMAGSWHSMIRLRAKCLDVPVHVDYDHIKGLRLLSIRHRQQTYATSSQEWRVEDALLNLPMALEEEKAHEMQISCENENLTGLTERPFEKGDELSAIRGRLTVVIELMDAESKRLLEEMKSKGGYETIEQWIADNVGQSVKNLDIDAH